MFVNNALVIYATSQIIFLPNKSLTRPKHIYFLIYYVQVIAHLTLNCSSLPLYRVDTAS